MFKKFISFESGCEYLGKEKGYNLQMAGPRGALVRTNGVALHLASLGCDGYLRFAGWPTGKESDGTVRRGQERLRQDLESYPG